MWNKRVFKVPQCASHWHKKEPALLCFLSITVTTRHTQGYLLLNMQGQITSWCNTAEVTVLTKSMFFQDLCLIISELTEYLAGLTPSGYFICKLQEVITEVTLLHIKLNEEKPCQSSPLHFLGTTDILAFRIWAIVHTVVLIYKAMAYTNYSITVDTNLKDRLYYLFFMSYISLLRFQFFLTFTACILSLQIINYYTRNICSIFG